MSSELPIQTTRRTWYDFLDQVDRRVIYLFVALSLSIPIIMDVRLTPAPMATADAFFKTLDEIDVQSGQIVLVAMDWGPGTMAENKPQTMVALEHLMRRRIPFALITIYTQAVPFLQEVPREIVKRLEQEHPGEKWEYGKDWVNLGFRPGGLLMIQNLAKSKDLADSLKKDANQIPLTDLPAFTSVKSIEDIPMLMEFTGLVGAFNAWLQFFPAKTFVHGCTSITIPEAFIYYSSKQIVGFFEGVAGAAWYEVLLNKRYSARDANVAIRINTGLAFAQIIVMAFMVLGNLGLLLRKLSSDDG